MKNIKGNKNNITVNEGPINISKNDGSNIVIGTQIYNSIYSEKKDEIEYEVTKGKLKINKKFISLTGGTLTIGGLVGFISNIITIIQGYNEGKIFESNFPFPICGFIFLIGLIILIFIKEMKRKRIATFFPNYIFGFNVVLSDNGNISTIKIKGRCPKANCGGKLRFAYDEKEDEYCFICSRNSSQHIFEFDFTSLEY